MLFPDEAHAEPLATVKHLAELARKQGAQIETGIEVFDLDCDLGKVRSISTTRGELSADQFVLATGAWSGQIASKLNLNLPMLSG